MNRIIEYERIDILLCPTVYLLCTIGISYVISTVVMVLAMLLYPHITRYNTKHNKIWREMAITST